MNIQRFLFKLMMSAYYVLILSLLFAPLTISAVYARQGGWKYGFTFIQNSLEVGIFAAFAFGFLIGMYHVLSFEMVGKNPPENYLKSKQRVVVKGNIELSELKDKVESQFRVKDLSLENNVLEFRKKVHLSGADKVRVTQLEEGLFEVKSRPFLLWTPVDFARNFKTVTQLAKMIKGLI